LRFSHQLFFLSTALQRASKTLSMLFVVEEVTPSTIFSRSTMNVRQITVTHGMNVRPMLAAARELGFQISGKSGTDDVLLTHPLLPRIINLSTGRKDASRAATAALIKVRRQLLECFA
jgi:hypothetical protein